MELITSSNENVILGVAQNTQKYKMVDGKREYLWENESEGIGLLEAKPRELIIHKALENGMFVQVVLSRGELSKITGWFDEVSKREVPSDFID